MELAETKQDEQQLVLAPDQAPALAFRDDVEADRVDWVINQIAAEGYYPSEGGKPWKGRATLISSAALQFEIGQAAAEELIDRSIRFLFEGKRDKGSQAKLRLLESRIASYRQILLEAIKSGVKTFETTWEREYRYNADGTKQLDGDGRPITDEVVKRKTQVKGLDSMAFKLLLDLEDLVARLNNLGDDENTNNAFAELFAKIEKDTETGETKETTSLSVSQKLKNTDIKNLGRAGREVMERAIQGKKNKKASAKPVKSRVIDSGEDNGSAEEPREAFPFPEE